MENALASIRVNDQLAAPVPSEAKVEVWDVGKESLEEQQHVSHGNRPSVLATLGGGDRVATASCPVD